LDSQAQYQVDPSKFRSKARNSPFAGMQLRGRAVVTIVGGKVVWQAS